MNLLLLSMEQVISLWVKVMSKIGLKLFCIILIMSTGSLLFTAVLLNSRVRHHFEEYIYEETFQEVTSLISVIEEAYQQEGNWRSAEDFFRRYFTDGQLLFYFQTEDGQTYSNINIMGQGRRMERFSIESAEHYQLHNQQGEVVADFYWHFPIQQRGATRRGVEFLENINNTVFLVGAIMALLSIIISFILSRYLTGPLVKMNKVTSAVAGGNYNLQVKLRGNDELTELGESLNRMVRRLKYLEKVREESTDDLVHELRTPLSIISSYLAALEDGVFELDVVLINEMQEELQRLEKLIGGLEQLVDVEKNVFALNNTELDLEKIIEQVIHNFNEKAREKGIKLSFKTDQKNYTVRGDPSGVKIIFNNLVSNSIKYSEEDSEVVISLTKKADSCIVQVIDHGIGIPQKDIPFIFERFYRTDKSRSTSTGGSGLGLAITRNLVRLHQGEITVSSEEHRTVFKVIIPAVKEK